MNLNGGTTGVTASISVPASGHVSMFVHELFPGMPIPFKGVMRVTASGPVNMVSLRTRYNERGDFLITTTPVTNEASPAGTAELFFPHIVDGGGYSTQFILFSGSAGQSSSGTLQFFFQTGQP